MTEQIIIFIALLVLGTRLVVAAIVIGTSGWYDALHVKKNKPLTPPRQPSGRKPAVSALLYARDNENSIGASLHSLLKNASKDLRIIVIDNASQDATAIRVRSIIKQHPQANIRLVAKRKPSPKKIAFIDACKKYATSKLVLTLSAGELIDADAIQKAAQRFKQNPTLGTLYFNVYVTATPSLFALMQRFEMIAHSYYEKTLALSLYHPQHYTTAAMRHKETLLVSGGTTETAHNINIQHQPIVSSNAYLAYLRTNYNVPFYSNYKSVSAILRRSNLVLTSLEPFMAAYFIYLAFSLNNPQLLMLSWVVLSIWLAFIIWNHQQLRFVEKCYLTLFIPPMYALRFVQSLVIGGISLLRVRHWWGRKQFTPQN